MRKNKYLYNSISNLVCITDCIFNNTYHLI